VQVLATSYIYITLHYIKVI